MNGEIIIDFGEMEKGQTAFDTIGIDTLSKKLAVRKSCGSCTRTFTKRRVNKSGFDVDIEFTPNTRGRQTKFIKLSYGQKTDTVIIKSIVR